MNTFVDHRLTFEAKEISSSKKGELFTFTEIRIKGNYKTGPVPVTIAYRFIFSYRPSYKDAEGNEINASSKDFDTAKDRDMYCSNHFKIINSKVRI